MQKNFERSTTDNISFAPQIESKQNWTEREDTRIKIVEKGAKRCQKISGTKENQSYDDNRKDSKS